MASEEELEEERQHLRNWIDRYLRNQHNALTFGLGWSPVTKLPPDERAYWNMKRELLTRHTREERDLIAQGDDLRAQVARELGSARHGLCR